MPTRRISSRISRRVRSRNEGSRLDSGSSSRSTRGSGASARASATRCCCPPESCPMRRRSKPGQIHQGQRARDPPVQLLASDAQRLEAEGDVLPDVEVGKEGVVLEHHAEAASDRFQPGHVFAFDQHAALVRHLEAGQQPERRGLPAPTGTQQREHLPPLDGERQIVDRQRCRRSAW